MRKRILIGLISLLVLVCGNNQVLAQQKKETKPAVKSAEAKPQQALTQTDKDRQREVLIADINNMRNQELRLAVLQQIINEEVAKLRNIQAVFCDQYKLDIEKFRKGLYRYDEKQEKFVEEKQAAN